MTMIACPGLYTLQTRLWTLQDGAFNKRGLLFHIESDDYFGTLATLLGLLKEEIDLGELSGQTRSWALSMLETQKDHLMYLQERYRITEK